MEHIGKKGEIYLSKYSGWYSVSDEAFYTEDEVEDKDGNKLAKLSGSQLNGLKKKNRIFLNCQNGKINF